MDEALARALLTELRKFGDTFNVLSGLSMTIPEENERAEFRRALGALMLDCDQHLIRPIERRYPQLEGIAIDKS